MIVNSDRVGQAGTREGVRHLTAFLGAAAQVAIASADGHHIMQMQAQPGVPRKGSMQEMPAPTLPFGPDLGLTQTFDTPGLYKVWVQAQRAGRILIAPFTTEVR